MKVSEKQVDELYKFTRQKQVVYYDVQTELVDHLANDIEAIWQENPTLSFIDARNRAFKKFGIFGFSEVVEQKTKQMTKRYWKILLRFTKEWFTVPKILATTDVFFLFFFLFQLKTGPAIFLMAFVFVVIYFILTALWIWYQTLQRKQKEQRLFLLEEMIHKTKNGLILMTLVNIVNVFNLWSIDFSTLHLFWIGLISLALTLLTICLFIMHFTIPNRAEALLMEVYPEYKLQKNL